MRKGEKSAMLNAELRAKAFRAHSLRWIATTLANVSYKIDGCPRRRYNPLYTAVQENYSDLVWFPRIYAEM